MPELTVTGRIARTSTRHDAAALVGVTAGAACAPAPTRLARMLALAVHVERLIDAGELVDHADAARRLGLTRARLSQVAALTRLPIDVQKRILLGTVRATERGLRVRRGPTRARATKATVAAPVGQGARRLPVRRPSTVPAASAGASA